MLSLASARLGNKYLFNLSVYSVWILCNRHICLEQCSFHFHILLHTLGRTFVHSRPGYSRRYTSIYCLQCIHHCDIRADMLAHSCPLNPKCIQPNKRIYSVLCSCHWHNHCHRPAGNDGNCAVLVDNRCSRSRFYCNRVLTEN